MDIKSIIIFLYICKAFACFCQDSGSKNIPDNMVLIPGGKFLMGKNSDGENDFRPAHEVWVDSFYMDKHEVTNAEYLRFCKETNHRLPEFWRMDSYKSGPDFPDHPVIGVSWYDAMQYAQWVGKRLPFEAEWEYAARGGFTNYEYPTTNEIDTTIANIAFRGVFKGPLKVGSYEPNSYGLYDMAGNVNEWIIDLYSYSYYATSPEDNPRGPDKGRFRVIRGGGWHSGPSCHRVYYRNGLPANWVDFAVGFRCVRGCK